MESLYTDRNLRGNSSRWVNWVSKLAINTCKFCADNHGKIVAISHIYQSVFSKSVAAHPFCNCTYVPMRTLKAGMATSKGYNGADAYLLYFNKLPDYYISKSEVQKFGWQDWKGNLSDILPNKMIGGDVFQNRNRKLPDKDGRIWFEADINYTKGYRNSHRILYSNDGLIFVTYDHYNTFYEITS